jgi:hypothetical protein
MESRKAHWDHIYAKPENEVSWYQENPAVSLELIRAAGTPQAALTQSKNRDILFTVKIFENRI